jgi:hypothetical protein
VVCDLFGYRVECRVTGAGNSIPQCVYGISDELREWCEEAMALALSWSFVRVVVIGFQVQSSVAPREKCVGEERHGERGCAMRGRRGERGWSREARSERMRGSRWAC